MSHMNVYVFIFEYIQVNLHACRPIHAYIHAYIHAHTHTYTHIYIHTRTDEHTYMHNAHVSIHARLNRHAWGGWICGKFGAFRPEGRRFKAHSSRHVRTFRKSITHNYP